MERQRIHTTLIKHLKYVKELHVVPPEVHPGLYSIHVIVEVPQHEVPDLVEAIGAHLNDDGR